MNFNLTCQKTHILAWANVDDTLSLKINGVKYLGFPKLDKRGGKYWKIDSLNSPKKVQVTEPQSSSKKLDLNKPIGEYTKEELALWQAQQTTQSASKSMTAEEYLAKLESEKLQEQIESQSQKTLEQLAEKITNHESINKSVE